MANRFQNPYPQFFSATPEVGSGWKLYFYASESSTPLDTYSDSSLATANANPVVLNSRGEPATAIFLQNLPYKVVLKAVAADDTETEVWTADPVYSSDYSAQARFLSGDGSPSGTVAGTAGSAGVPADVYWDYTNQILYVCTATGTVLTAEWTAVNASSAASVIPPPQGYLTLVTGTPVIVSDQASKATVYYTPDVGDLIPIHNGSAFVPLQFTELSLSLVASHAGSAIYDVFVFNNSGVLTLVTGPAWSTPTAGSGARGTGSGTTQLTRLNGLYINTVQITGRNGSTTYTIAAQRATYVGSLLIDSGGGTVTCHTSVGQTRKWGVWNAYNKRPVILTLTDATASWNYNTATIRQSRGSANNTVAAFCGLAEERVKARFNQTCKISQDNGVSFQTSAGLLIGIGLNSTTAFSGKTGEYARSGSNFGSLVLSSSSDIVAEYVAAPSLGLNNFNALENTPTTSTSTAMTFFGGASMRFVVEYFG